MLNAEEFVRLRQSDRSEDYLRAANESAEKEVWLDIIQRFPEMRVWVAHNKTVPLEILALLARDEDPAVRSFVAMKNKLSSELFGLLARDRDSSVRERIAHNKNTPLEVLRALTEDPNEPIALRAHQRLRGL